MMDAIRRLFSKQVVEDAFDQEEDKTHRIHLATCALLLELAYINGEFSDDERHNIIAVFKRDYKLSDGDISQLMEASEKELTTSIDLWRFTNFINQNYTVEQKIQIVETVWKVAYADGTLDKHEDYLAHKIATLLRLDHKQLIEAKVKVLHAGDE
jgi:uncharacterized tellurite resistance protein B-like protein